VGQPEFAFTDHSVSSSRSTDVAASSLPVGGRISLHRPGTAASLMARSAATFSAGSLTAANPPSTIAQR
jgi:hypothetical protein